jgi:hypothetical protein
VCRWYLTLRICGSHRKEMKIERYKKLGRHRA